MDCGCNGSTFVPPTPEEIEAHRLAGTTPPEAPPLMGPQAGGYFHTDEHNPGPDDVQPFDAAGHTVGVEA